jgi:hypothetical protein
MLFHIYSQDVCIGDIEDANSEDHALALYALRTGMDSVIGLTPVQVIDSNDLADTIASCGAISFQDPII